MLETFVVRVWIEERDGLEAGGTGSPRGVVEHVRSGTSSRFGGSQELLDFIESAVTLHQRPARGGDADV